MFSSTKTKPSLAKCLYWAAAFSLVVWHGPRPASRPEHAPSWSRSLSFTMSGDADIILGRMVRVDKVNATRGTQVGQWLVIANAKRSLILPVNGPIDIATLEVWADEGVATARATALLASGDWTDDAPPDTMDRTGFVAKLSNVKRSDLHHLVADWRSLCGTAATPTPTAATLVDPIDGKTIECFLTVAESGGAVALRKVKAKVRLWRRRQRWRRGG